MATEEKTPEASSPPWVELPTEITMDILQRLGVIEIIESAQRVCSTWWKVCHDPAMWRTVDLKCYGEYDDQDLEKICKIAVDRSQGQLLEISIESFGSEDLLNYIAERSGKLKRLSIAYCFGMVCDCLVEAVQMLPLLEEFSLTYTTITTQGIVALGHSCPQLKSFELNKRSSLNFSPSNHVEYDRNLEALAIAKNLPSLRHLQLIGNSMTKEGLQAILDGCPHLVSLDLRLCNNDCLDEVLSSRISRHIKDVKLPHDSMEGITFGFEPLGDIDEYSIVFC